MWCKEHAVAITNIISQCFGDIQQVEELDIELMEGIVHGPILILVPTRRTKDDCCELIAHKVEIENLFDNLSVGVAFKVFFFM